MNNPRDSNVSNRPTNARRGMNTAKIDWFKQKGLNVPS